METKLRYFVYCRKSSEARDRQALSIEAQKRELSEYAQRNELSIVKVFEESQSAFKLGRPIFAKMMDLCNEGVANALLTWKPDRLARNAMDGGRVIQALDDKVLQEIRTPYELFRQEDNRMMLYVLFGMSNDFSRQISANVRRGQRQKYARGEFLGKAPLGYLNAEIGNSRNIVPDPVKAPLVKQLFEKCATGAYSISQIAKQADECGLLSIYGNHMWKSETYALLRRSVYYGVYYHGGEYHQGSFEPIISKDLFDRVQKVISDRGKPKKEDWVHIYKGLMKCAVCGSAITAETKRKFYPRTGRHAEYTYYRCTRRKGHCGQPAVTEAEMEQMIQEMVWNIFIDKEVWDLAVELLRAKHASQVDLGLQLKAQLNKEMELVDKKLGKLLDMRMREEITQIEYAGYKKELLDKQVELKEKLRDREQSSGNWLELAERFFEICYQAREIMQSDNDEEKKRLVRKIGWNLFLKDGKLDYTLRKPWDIMLKPDVRSDVQGW